MKSTGNYWDEIKNLKKAIEEADAIVIGAGAGLSTSAGFVYNGERFEKHFSEFGKKYGFHDMYSGGFYPYDTPEEMWAYWSRFIFVNRFVGMIFFLLSIIVFSARRENVASDILFYILLHLC